MKKTPLFVVLRAVSAAALLAAGALAPNLAFAQATKVPVCHVTGNGGHQLISVAANAVRAHIGHGDVVPGETTGTSSPGDYGSTVTPMTVVGEDCLSSSVLKIEATVHYQANQSSGQSAGWAGWSCLEDGYPKVVGGGYTPTTATIKAEGPAKSGAAAIDTFNYPIYPNYTFPNGEEGWVVEGTGPTPPTGIYVICGQ